MFRRRILLIALLLALTPVCLPTPYARAQTNAAAVGAGSLTGRLQYCVVDATGALLGYMEYGERGADDARTVVIRACESVATWKCTREGLAELQEEGYVGIRFVTEECVSRLSLADATAAMTDAAEGALLELHHSGKTATLILVAGEVRTDLATLLT